MVGSPKKRARREAAAAQLKKEQAAQALRKPITNAIAAEWEDPVSANLQSLDERFGEPHRPREAQPTATDPALEAALSSLVSGPIAAPDKSQDAILESQEQFNEIYKLAMDDAIYILKLKIDPNHKDFSKILTRKTAIIASVMSAAVRVDEARVRGIRKSQVDRVLDIVRAAEAKLLN